MANKILKSDKEAIDSVLVSPDPTLPLINDKALTKSELYMSLSNPNKKLLMDLWSNIYKYTEGEWSEEQYYLFCTMAYSARKLDMMITSDPTLAEPKEREELRRTKEAIYNMIASWRDNRRATVDTITALRMRAEEHNLRRLEITMDFTPNDKTPSKSYKSLEELNLEEARKVGPKIGDSECE